jgi:hypothetical protein
MQTAPPPDRCDAWAVQIARLPGHNKVAIALANKLARIVWVVWRHGTDYVGTLRANFADYPVHERVLARQGCVEGKARPGADGRRGRPHSRSRWLTSPLHPPGVVVPVDITSESRDLVARRPR